MPDSKSFKLVWQGGETVGWTKDRKGRRVHEMLVSQRGLEMRARKVGRVLETKLGAEGRRFAGVPRISKKFGKLPLQEEMSYSPAPPLPVAGRLLSFNVLMLHVESSLQGSLQQNVYI